jgi:hypothetical protein
LIGGKGGVGRGKGALIGGKGGVGRGKGDVDRWAKGMLTGGQKRGDWGLCLDSPGVLFRCGFGVEFIVEFP